MIDFSITPHPGPNLDLAQVKGFVFDLDGTLYSHDPVRRIMALRILRAHLRHPLQGLRTLCILRSYRQAQEALRLAPISGDPLDQQIRLAAQRCKVQEWEVNSCVSYWTSRAMDLLTPALRPGLLDFLQLARQKGMLLAVLSDYPAEAKLTAMGLRDYFDVVVSADDSDVQCFKPEPRGLEVVLRRLGLKKNEAVYVGDRPTVDGFAAISAGMACAILGSQHKPSGPWCEISGFNDLLNALRARDTRRQGRKMPAPCAR
jgi:HAD superfamily hydrolase (TIGR01509 family)